MALVAGVAHALAPGHGKSITAAYLVGAHGRVVHAVYLGLVVAAMHTVSAIALAALWHGLRAVLPFEFSGMTGVLQVAAAVVVLSVGVALVRRHGRVHHHDHHGHSHTDPDKNPFTREGLVALGLSGGLVPSPTVFLILVSGLVTGRVGFAVLLVVTFGIGMMLTISGVGLLTLKGMHLVDRGRSPVLRRVSVVLPRLAAYAVVFLGVTYLVVGVRGLVI